MNLAKMAASTAYMDLVEQLMNTALPPPRHRGRVVEFFWRLYDAFLKSIGWPTTTNAAILGTLIAQLKAEAEKGWKQPIDRVSLTAPWQRAWLDDNVFHSDINEAQNLAGLQPWTMDTMQPLYLGESYSVLAANGHQVCQYGCDEPPGDDDEPTNNQAVFLIGFMPPSAMSFGASRIHTSV